LPITIAPASSSFCTTAALAGGSYAKSGQAAVVGKPRTSILSFTANGMPYNGNCNAAGSACKAAARDNN
jgi:hypothetical protein